MENSNAMTKIIGALIIGLIGGFFIGQAVDRNQTPSPEEMMEEGEEMMEEEMSGVPEEVVMRPNSLLVNDQSADDQVLIARVVLPNATWVAIHEDRGDGMPGNILGAAVILAGDQLNQVIDLVRPTEAGRTYFAMLHINDGVSGFEFRAGDVPLLGSDGNPVMVSFRTI